MKSMISNMNYYYLIKRNNHVAYEQMNEGLPGALEKIMRKTWAPRAQGADAEHWVTRTDSPAMGNLFSFDSHDSGGVEQTQEATCNTCGRALGHHYKSCPQICWGLPCLRKMVLVRSRRRNF